MPTSADDGPGDSETPTTPNVATERGPQTLGSLVPEPTAPAADSGSTSRYSLGAVIGRGGMGEVRIARDHRVGRDVPSKVLRGDGRRREDLRTRFLREARVQGGSNILLNAV